MEDTRLRVTYGHALARCLACRRLFRIVEGHFGLGSEVLEKGGLVFFLHRLSSPIILRRTQTPEEAGGGVGSSANDDENRQLFQVIGEAYVHGVMSWEEMGTDCKWRELRLV